MPLSTELAAVLVAGLVLPVHYRTAMEEHVNPYVHVVHAIFNSVGFEIHPEDIHRYPIFNRCACASLHGTSQKCIPK